MGNKKNETFVIPKTDETQIQERQSYVPEQGSIVIKWKLNTNLTQPNWKRRL